MSTVTALEPVTDNANWTGTELASRTDWQFEWSSADIEALMSMAASVRPSLDSDPNRLLTLPAERLDIGPARQQVSAIFEALKDGPGLALVKGLPVNDLDPIDAAIIYWAIGLQLGQATPNNPDGDLIGHVTNLGKTQADPNSRGYQTREAMDYHCDQCDLVALLCVRTALSGGVSMLASSVAMYNRLLTEQPELARALTQSLCWTKHGEYVDGELPYYESPVFNFLDGKLCTSFGPKHIFKGHDLPETPDLTDLQRQAIEAAEAIADAQRIEMTFEPGDMQFANNYVILHTRSAYQDHPDPHQKRLLWRLWLMNPALRPRTNYTRQWQKGVTPGSRHMQIRL